MATRKLPRLLQTEQLERVHEAALRLLSRTGLAVTREDVLGRLRGLRGFTVSSGRVRIAPELVNLYVEQLRGAKLTEPPDAPDDGVFRVLVEDRPMNVVESDHRTIRPATVADAVRATKLMDGLAGRLVATRCPCMPRDVPDALAPIEQYAVAFLFGRNGGYTSDVRDLRTARAIRAMDRVQGRREFTMSLWMPSPLRFEGQALDIILPMQTEITRLRVGSMPLMGVAGPMGMVANLTLAVAEVLGGAALLTALAPGVPITPYFHPQAWNVRTGAMLSGAAEWNLFDLLKRDVNAFYGLDWRTKTLDVGCPLPGPQAQMEKAASVLFGAEHGFTVFEAAGVLSLDEVWSEAQFLLDLGTVDYAARMTQGIEAETDFGFLDETVEAIDRVIRTDDTFATDERTILLLRRVYSDPAIYRCQSLGQWLGGQGHDALRAAQSEADRLVAAHTFEPPADQRREIERIVKKCREEWG